MIYFLYPYITKIFIIQGVFKKYEGEAVFTKINE